MYTVNSWQLACFYDPQPVKEFKIQLSTLKCVKLKVNFNNKPRTGRQKKTGANGEPKSLAPGDVAEEAEKQ